MHPVEKVVVDGGSENAFDDDVDENGESDDS